VKNFSVLSIAIILSALALTPETGEAAGHDYAVIFYSGRGESQDVYILPPGEKEPRNLTNHPAQDLCPAASPDGERIAFLSDREGNMDIFSMKIDGSDPLRLTHDPAWDGWASFVPRGKTMNGHESDL
jgi:Tol biopolymer transport system component